MKFLRNTCLTFIPLGLLLFSCSSGPNEPNLRPADELTSEGWIAFEAGDFGLAAAKFDSAMQSDPEYIDAYNGAGWANARLGNFDKAGENFDSALGLDGELIDANAGGALVFHAQNRFLDAIEKANFVLNVQPDFIFSHDPAVDALDIRITLALSYFSVGDFNHAAMQMDIIDPANSPHATSPDELIREIMRFFGQIR